MRVKLIIPLLCIFFIAFAQRSEKLLTGSVSFLSSQNVYVKFETTSGIRVGDTLFLKQKAKFDAAMVVKDLSSISCVCQPLKQDTLPISTPIFAKVIDEQMPIVIANEEKAKESVAVTDKAIASLIAENKEKENHQHIDGRVSFSSYSDLNSYRDNYRFRYNLALNTSHIKNSKFSSEINVAVSHNSRDTLNAFTNIANYLKIYSLSVNYDIDSTSIISIGRKINPNIANVGAIDGVQYETKFNRYSFGAVLGSRPGYYDYGFDPSLFEYGAYVSHNYRKNKAIMRTTVGFFNQMKNGLTDRRFGYFQHSNTLLKRVDLFVSSEFELYKLDENWQPTNTFDVTSLYTSIRYNPFRNLSLSMSYDARKNVYYYQTFKNRVDSTIDKETRQGLRFQFSYRPFRFLSWGGYAGINNPHVSKNANTYLMCPDLPFIHTSLMIDATILRTQYTDGMIYGATMMRDIVPGVLFAQLQYRLVDYQFTNTPATSTENIAELSLSWQISGKLMFSADYEYSKEDENSYNRVFVNLTKRF